MKTLSANPSPSGLSPRMRGNRADAGAVGSPGRSIPAYAGEPLGVRFRISRSPVYPRVCGGTAGSIRGDKHREGLSPRMRGNRRASTAGDPPHRSIPAYAGEPGIYHLVDALCRVYPRVCGGTMPAYPAVWATSGLSPRMRGNHAGVSGGVGNLGSIPAYAGEPPGSIPACAGEPVYPRVCGGTPLSAQLDTANDRLSPRMRGNRERT